MLPPYKTYFNWSSGKDAALALYTLMMDNNYQVDYLLTSVNAHHNRVSMHGLRRALLDLQLKAIGIPYGTVELPEQPTNEQYQQLMKEKVEELKAKGFSHTAFGDIFLEDLRHYREKQLEKLGITAVFPLWKKNTRELVKEFTASGFRTIVICVNAGLLHKSFAGRIIDEQFINDLPEGIDPCGENGEFHTFCFDGPLFKHPVHFTLGETVLKEYEHNGVKTGFWFTDLLPE